MTDFLFDTPFWLPLGIAAVGVFLFITGNRRQETRVRTAGVAAIALAVLLTAVSYFVDTDAEKVERRTREMVSAFVAKDWATLQGMMDPRANLTVGGLTLFDGREQIMAAARRAQERDQFSSIVVTSLTTESSERGDFITAALGVTSNQEATAGRPVPSQWEFEWQRGADKGWAVTQIRAMELGNLRPDQIPQQFPTIPR